MKTKPTVSKSRTSIEVASFEHIWIIEQFSHCHEQKTEFIDSAPFSNELGEFTLRLYPCWTDPESQQKYISLFLKCDPVKPGVKLGVKFCVLDPYGIKYFTYEFEHTYDKPNIIGLCEFISHRIREQNASIWQFVTLDDKLKIYCKIDYIKSIETKDEPKKDYPILGRFWNGLKRMIA